MKYMAALGLMLSLGVASVYAEQQPVKMTFSGTSATAATNLQYPNTSNDEDTFAGDGTLGQFTLKMVRAVSNFPDSSGTCPVPGQFYFTEPAGAGVFRFEDGSLLKVNLIKGHDCIDFVALEAHCTITFQITGGTGRFKNASGSLTFTETVKPVLADKLGNPVFLAATGEFTGKISGVARETDRQEDRHEDRQ